MYKCECGNLTEEYVCKQCGLVLDKEIVNIPERNINNEIPDKRTYSVKEVSPDLESHTTHSKNTSNKELKRVFYRERYYVNNDQEFWKGQIEIKKIIDFLGLPKNIEDEAIMIFKKMIKDNFFNKYHVKEKSYGACIKLACSIWKRPITFSEISSFSNTSVKKIRNVFYIIVKEYNYNYTIPSIAKIINIYSNKFNITEKDKTRMMKTAIEIQKKANTCGKSLFGYAAAIFYIYLKQKYGTIRDKVADLLEVTPHTITSRKREINKILKK